MSTSSLRETLAIVVLRPVIRCLLGAAVIAAAGTLLVRGVLSSWWLLNSIMVAAAMHPWLALPVDAGIALAAWCMVAKMVTLSNSCERDHERMRRLGHTIIATTATSITLGVVSSLLFPFMVGSAGTLTGARDAQAIAAVVPAATMKAGKDVPVPVNNLSVNVSLLDGRVSIVDPAGLGNGDPDMAACKAIAASPAAGRVTINHRPASTAACTWRFNNLVTVALPAGTPSTRHP